MFSRVEDIIHIMLAKRGIARYRLIDREPEHLWLPGEAYYQEIEVESGIIVTPEHAYRFDLGWENGQYTLGNEDRAWPELTSGDTAEYKWQKILQIQQSMRDDPTLGLREPPTFSRREAGKPTEREIQIIWWWLASSRLFADRDLTDYAGPVFETFEVIDVQSGGHDLVGSLLPGEVQDISGIVVVAQGAFDFHLSWVWGPENISRYRDPGHYSLGEKDGSWRLVLREECTEEQWQRLETIRQRLEGEFVKIPRLDSPTWNRLDEEEEQSARQQRAQRLEKERQPRVPRDLSKNRRKGAK